MFQLSTMATVVMLLASCLLLEINLLAGRGTKSLLASARVITVAQQSHDQGEILLPPLINEEPASLNILVIGDWGRQGFYNQSAVAQQMARVAEDMQAEFIISVGDNFYEDGLTGVDDRAFGESFSQIYTASSLQKTWHAVLGNHDYRGDALAQFNPALTALDPRWHCERSFSLKQALPFGSDEYVEFFFYDTNPFVDKYWTDTKHVYDWRGVEPRQEFLDQQKEFLRSGLASSNATWKVVVGHHPIRSVGDHGDTTELKDQILPILEEHDVHLYLNGHDHCLEHITQSGIHFLTSGGGSKAWRGMDKSADQNGLQFYYDGQGFLSLSFMNSSTIALAFHDALGNILHSAHILSMECAGL